MNKYLTKGQIALSVIFSVLVIDQIIKIWIKTHMYWHESIRVTDWFYIFFTENNGMAFGMEIFGKLFLTLFRLVAVSVIGWFLYKFVKHGMKTGFIVCVSLILTGALGNIIDSVFYGVLFSESTASSVATFLPEGGGYAPWFYGKVVDMLSIPIGLRGCHLWVENTLSSLAPSSTLPMRLSVVALSPCCCFIASILMTLITQ